MSAEFDRKNWLLDCNSLMGFIIARFLFDGNWSGSGRGGAIRAVFIHFILGICHWSFSSFIQGSGHKEFLLIGMIQLIQNRTLLKIEEKYTKIIHKIKTIFCSFFLADWVSTLFHSIEIFDLYSFFSFFPKIKNILSPK